MWARCKETNAWEWSLLHMTLTLVKNSAWKSIFITWINTQLMFFSDEKDNMVFNPQKNRYLKSVNILLIWWLKFQESYTTWLVNIRSFWSTRLRKSSPLLKGTQYVWVHPNRYFSIIVGIIFYLILFSNIVFKYNQLLWLLKSWNEVR